MGRGGCMIMSNGCGSVYEHVKGVGECIQICQMGGTVWMNVSDGCGRVQSCVK